MTMLTNRLCRTVAHRHDHRSDDRPPVGRSQHTHRTLGRMALALALLCVSLVVTPFGPAATVSAAAVYSDGRYQYSEVVDCVSLIQGNPYTTPGVGTWVGFRTDSAAAKPGPNDIYYVHVVIGGIGNACAGQFAQIELGLPPSTTPAISGSTPVFCYYNGGSLPANCPQSLGTGSAPGRLWIPNLGSASRLWAIPTGGTVEIQVPVRSTTPLTGQNLTGFITMADGNNNPLLVPTAPVWVFGVNQSGLAPTITYPNPSTTGITQTAALSTAYLQPQGIGGNAYFDLSLSPTMSSILTTDGPAMVPGGDPDGYEVFADWTGLPYVLTSGTTYYWRMRYLYGGMTVTGATQTFSTAPGNQATIGNGSAASCTSAALAGVLAGPAIDIRFNCGGFPTTITLTSTMTINRALTIDGDDLVTLVAPAGSRHFNVTSGSPTYLRDLSLTGGNPSGCGGAISVQSGAFVWVDSSRVTGNRATTGGGACVAAGGGLFVHNGSSVSGNTATDSGGGVYGAGVIEVQDSEVSGNSATNDGGGVTALDGVSVIRSTLAGNTAGAPSSATALGGAILTNGYTTVRTSTLSGNTAGDGAAIAVTGSNYVAVRGATIANNTARSSTGGAARFGSSASSDFVVGTMFSNNQPRSCSSVSGAQQIVTNGWNHDTGASCVFFGANDRSNVQANLGPLAPNGGPTRTHALLLGSSGIDGGTNSSCDAKDQRGISVPTSIGTTRALDGDGNGTATCDVGSYEVKRDGVAPTVIGVDLLDASPTAATSVRWRVRFSEPVVGVDAADFVLTTTGVTGAMITTVVAEATAPTSNWIVTSASGSGASGTVRLDVLNSATIGDASNMPLVAGATGSVYNVNRPAGPPPGPGGGFGFVAVAPARLLDSRAGGSTVDGLFRGLGVSGPGSVVELQVAGRAGVPGDASAVVLNVTAASASGGGYVTVFPCGSAPPNSSNLNTTAGGTVPNAVTVKVGAGGKVCLFTSPEISTHLLADVNGYFPAGG